MAEAILLAGALYGVWNIAMQRHKQLNNHDQASSFDDPTGKNRYNSKEVAPYIYHEQQDRVNYGEILGPKWEMSYTSRQARSRRSAKKPELDRSIYFQNGYMPTTLSRFIDEAVTPCTHADFSEDGRGRLMAGESCILNENLIAT
jgi:hypothetical protein